MTKEEIRIGIIGAGQIGKQHLAACLHNNT